MHKQLWTQSLWLGLAVALSACPKELPVETRENVRGVVVDELGQPLQKVTVSIAGHHVASDATGHFALDSVKLPYDLKALVGESQLAVFMGMTKLDPTLRITGVTAPGTQTATLELTGVTLADNDVAHGIGVLIETPGRAKDTVLAGSVASETGTRLYRFEWPAGSPLHVHARAFQYDRDEKNAAPTHITTMAEFDGTFSTDTKWEATWQAYKGGETQVIVDNTGLLPPLARTEMHVQTANTVYPFVTSTGDARGSVQFTVPSIESATVTAASVHDDSGVGNYALAGPTALAATTLKLAAQIPYDRLTTSAQGRGSAKDLTFEWHGYGNAGYLKIDPVGAPSNPQTIIMFDGSMGEAKLPDLSEFGLSWPKNAHYVWRLVTTGEQSVDDEAQLGMYALAPAGYGDSHDFTFE